jgi:hypothetical protein
MLRDGIAKMQWCVSEDEISFNLHTWGFGFSLQRGRSQRGDMMCKKRPRSHIFKNLLTTEPGKKKVPFNFVM